MCPGVYDSQHGAIYLYAKMGRGGVCVCVCLSVCLQVSYQYSLCTRLFFISFLSICLPASMQTVQALQSSVLNAFLTACPSAGMPSVPHLQLS